MKFQLSINKNMINKANPSTWGWRNTEFSGEDLAEHIKEGFAFSPVVLKPNAKATKPAIKDVNFAQILAIDIDNDIKSYNSNTKKYDKKIKSFEEGYLSFKDAVNDEFVRKNALLIYTTPRHKEDWHRFRIVFVQNEGIYNPVEYRDKITILIDKFGGDKSCSNIDRLFYGNRDCDLVYFGKVLNSEILSPKVEQLL